MSLAMLVRKSPLETALTQDGYSAFYTALQQYTEPLDWYEALQLVRTILNTPFTTAALKAILEHSPPLAQLMDGNTTIDDINGQELIARAAQAGGTYLDVLLKAGASPNRQQYMTQSPLEAAIQAGKRSSVSRLLREPELDTSLTPELLRLWAQADWDQTVRYGWQPAAQRLTGQAMPKSGPVPLLEKLTVCHAAMGSAWDLLARLCQVQGRVSAEEALETLEFMASQVEDIFIEVGWEEMALVLDMLLDVCPALLRRKRVQQYLVLCILELPEDACELQKWLDRLPRKRILLWKEQELKELTNQTWVGKFGLLARWERQMKGKLTPVLDRSKPLPVFPIEFWELEERDNFQEELDFLVRTCLVQGKPRPGVLSPLARDVLRWCSAGLVEEQLQPGGFLAREDPAALRACVQNEEVPRKNRQVLAVYVQAEENPYRL